MALRFPALPIVLNWTHRLHPAGAQCQYGIQTLYQIIPVQPFDLVLFGATGDLARREILPALFGGFCVGQVPEGFRLAGVSRSRLTDEEFRTLARNAIVEARSAAARDRDAMRRFLSRLEFISADVTGGNGWDRLAEWPRRDTINAYYLSVGPAVFESIFERLGSLRMVRPDTRIVVEKPFGENLASARRLNRVLARTFNEAQIYRIDHYLGKETVQNLMALRFANALFEPVWNARHIDHIQITVAESVGIKGRQGYYDTAGAMRDMVQNHLMQLLCLVAMEPPSAFEPDNVRDEKLKVIRALEPVSSNDVVRGQYSALNHVESYLSDADTDLSATESYIALRCRIANWRWAGTPFYLRTGKRLNTRKSEIAVVFKNPPHSIFGEEEAPRNNVLAIRLQPDEGIKMHVTIKEPGPGGMRLTEAPLDMSFAGTLGPDIGRLMNAYERLIMDVIRGNQTLFMRNDEVEAAWEWTDAVIDSWQAAGTGPEIYVPGSEGPPSADEIMDRGRRWRGIAVG